MFESSTKMAPRDLSTGVPTVSDSIAQLSLLLLPFDHVNPFIHHDKGSLNVRLYSRISSSLSSFNIIHPI